MQLKIQMENKCKEESKPNTKDEKRLKSKNKTQVPFGPSTSLAASAVSLSVRLVYPLMSRKTSAASTSSCSGVPPGRSAAARAASADATSGTYTLHIGLSSFECVRAQSTTGTYTIDAQGTATLVQVNLCDSTRTDTTILKKQTKEGALKVDGHYFIVPANFSTFA